MLQTLKRFFDDKIKQAQDEALDAQLHRLHLATAALLQEMVRMDDEVTADECARVAALMRSRFGLTDEETETLLALAEEERRAATDYFQFTSLINANFTPAQKERIIQDLWEVALIDGQVDSHERHYLGKLAGLLHISKGAVAHAKMRAQAALRAENENGPRG